MEPEEVTHKKRRIRKNILKVAKATIKAASVCVIYIILAGFITPVTAMIPGFQHMIETLVIVYVALMIVSDLTADTIFQHFFNTARAIFVIVYLLLLLSSGVFEYNFGSVNLIIDLRLFLVIAMLLGLLGLAKSVLQAINYMSEKSELTRI